MLLRWARHRDARKPSYLRTTKLLTYHHHHHVLINDACVDFAGYCVPHPSEPVVHIRVQANVNSRPHEEEEEKDGQQPLSAIEALKDACTTLSDQCDLVVALCSYLLLPLVPVFLLALRGLTR